MTESGMTKRIVDEAGRGHAHRAAANAGADRGIAGTAAGVVAVHAKGVIRTAAGAGRGTETNATRSGAARRTAINRPRPAKRPRQMSWRSRCVSLLLLWERESVRVMDARQGGEGRGSQGQWAEACRRWVPPTEQTEGARLGKRGGGAGRDRKCAREKVHARAKERESKSARKREREREERERGRARERERARGREGERARERVRERGGWGERGGGQGVSGCERRKSERQMSVVLPVPYPLVLPACGASQTPGMFEPTLLT